MTVKVLILEDNPSPAALSRVVRGNFSDVSSITEAGDRKRLAVFWATPRAGRLLPTKPPHQLILVDLELPGWQRHGVAQGNWRPIRPPRIVTTLYSDDEHLFPALQCGADGYLLQEDRFEVLVEELQKIVRGQPPHRPPLPAGC